MKKLIFFIVASALLLFSIIVVNIAPAINGLIGSSWSSQSCSYISDYYDDQEKKQASTFSITDGEKEKEAVLDHIKKWRSRCNNRKAMVGLEYVTSNLNIVFGCICTLLGFLHFINVGNIGKYIGLIGLGAGIIGFVLTFVYVIESGLVFNDVHFDFSSYVDNPSRTPSTLMRIDSDGAFLEWDGKKYTCIFYNKDDRDSIYLRFSDFGKKYLNYHKDLHYAEGDKQYILSTSSGCVITTLTSWERCKNYEEAASSNRQHYLDGNNNIKDCDKIYFLLSSSPTDNYFKVIYDRWLTTIIFSCFIFLLNIALAIFGFLLFKESGGSSGSVAIK